MTPTPTVTPAPTPTPSPTPGSPTTHDPNDPARLNVLAGFALLGMGFIAVYPRKKRS